MRREILENILVLIGVFLFDFLFWEQGMGLNVFIFNLFLSAALIKIYPEGKQSKTFLLTAAATWILSILVVIHHSSLSKFMYICSTLFMVGFAKQHSLRFLLFGILISFREMFSAPAKAIGRIRFGSSKRISLFKSIGMAVLPFIFLLIFFQLYRLASPHFAALTSRFFSNFTHLFSADYDSVRILFLVFTFMLVGGFLWRPSRAFFAKSQANLQEDLIRTRSKTTYFRHKMLELKTEYQIALISIFSLNALLLLVNLLDVQYVWYGYKGFKAMDLSTFVHEGTYALIASILLAISILTYFFRRNLHFYPNGQLLKTGAYIWIAQNALLVLSVGVRNLRYVDYFGLAFKRVGVFIFLILVLSGLFLMYLKIKKDKSIYFLFNRNTWAAYGILVLASFVNWEIAISGYNIHVQHKSQLDINFLSWEMSDKNLYLIKKNKEKIAHRSGRSIKGIEQIIKRKEGRFERRVNRRTWKDWNYADYRNMNVTAFSEKE